MQGIASAFPALVPSQPDVFVPTDRTGGMPSSRSEVIIDFPEAVDALLSGRAGSGKKLFAAWEGKCKGDLRSAITGGQWSQARLAAIRSWTDTSLCQLCQQSIGTLMHRHECPATMPAEGWPGAPQQALKVKELLSNDRNRLLTTRGLFVLKVSLPAPPLGDTFTWLLPLPEEVDETGLTWFVDGSLFDESKRIMRRTGFGAAAIDPDGSLVAFGHGLPPSWVQDAAGAELWAVYFVLNMLGSIPFVVTDCKGILDGLQGSPQSVTQHDKALARIWSRIRHILDDDFSVMRTRMRWMPSHTSIQGITNSKDSTGQPITPLMWRANRLVDSLAKLAAGRHRLPAWAFKKIGAAALLVKHAAAQLGVVTHSANNHKVDQMIEGGAVVTRVCRDSTAERQRPRFFKAAPPTAKKKSGHLQTAACPEACLAGTPPPATASRGTKRTFAEETTSAAARQKRARAAKKKLQLRQGLEEQEQVARWVASRELAAAGGPTAQERIERLRQRLRDKQPTGVAPSP